MLYHSLYFVVLKLKVRLVAVDPLFVRFEMAALLECCLADAALELSKTLEIVCKSDTAH